VPAGRKSKQVRLMMIRLYSLYVQMSMNVSAALISVWMQNVSTPLAAILVDLVFQDSVPMMQPPAVSQPGSCLGEESEGYPVA